MARGIFEPSVSSDSSVNLMCNNMGFLKNLLSSDFGGHFFSFSSYILWHWVQTKSMFYRWLNLVASPFLLISVWNLHFTVQFWLYIRPPQYGTTSEAEDSAGIGEDWDQDIDVLVIFILERPKKFSTISVLDVSVLFLTSKVLCLGRRHVKITEFNSKMKVSNRNQQKRRRSEVQPSVEHRFRLDSVS